MKFLHLLEEPFAIHNRVFCVCVLLFFWRVGGHILPFFFLSPFFRFICFGLAIL